MNAAIIEAPGAPPVDGTAADPEAGQDHRRIRVTAVALSHVTKSRASANHYSTQGVSSSLPGIDGVGLLDDGRRVYFLLPEVPHGSMAEWSIAARTVALNCRTRWTM